MTRGMKIGAKIYCCNCCKKTNHSKIAHESKSSDDDNYWWSENHYFAKCRGCDSITYAIETSTEDDHFEDRGSSWETYPRGIESRQSIHEVNALPPTIRQVYLEVLGAMNAQLPILVGIGLRALIEAICLDQEIEGASLEIKIDGLSAAGVLSAANASILHSHRFLGNVAAHELTSGHQIELDAAMDIAENSLKTIYIMPHLSRRITTGRKK